MFDNALNPSLPDKFGVVSVLLEASLGLSQLKGETLILIDLVVEIHEHHVQLTLAETQPEEYHFRQHLLIRTLLRPFAHFFSLYLLRVF